MPGLAGAAWSTLPAPIIGFVAFGLIAWRLVTPAERAGARVSAAAASYANG